MMLYITWGRPGCCGDVSDVSAIEAKGPFPCYQLESYGESKLILVFNFC